MIPFDQSAINQIDQVPGGQQDQGHGVVLHDQGEGYQQPITFRSGSRQLSISV